MISPDFDAIIIGGGAAGSSCALWLKLLGFNPCIIEQRDRLGGLQNDSPYPNPWIVASPKRSGVEIAGNIHHNIIAQDIRCFLNSTVVAIEKSAAGYFEVALHPHESLRITAPFLVIASGVKAITGGLQEASNILIGPGHLVANYDFADKRVAVLGGGDNAFENYAFAKSKAAQLVHIYAHSIRARGQFLEQTPATDVYLGNYSVDAQRYQVAGKSYDVILVFYGWAPHLPFLDGFPLKKNSKGLILTQRYTAETSQPGIYAIGEVTDRAHPSCVTAMADGVVAAKALQLALEGELAKDFIARVNRINAT